MSGKTIRFLRKDGEAVKIKIYVAAPLFTNAEREWNYKIATLLRKHWFVYLPQEKANKIPRETFSRNVEQLSDSNIVVAVLDGADADSGTCWEVGYAYAKGIPVVGLRTDLRNSGDDGGYNLMLSKSCYVLTSEAKLVIDVDNCRKNLEYKNKL